ncbi:6-hydroxy-D-nicotine oxidase protein [Rutstroemia sp. NJR-2017a BVV2]|nr:6-hydroxy-D-nicotine oxidase protein [Rutstroemia sp. NJR-2017a BVV2]
MAPSLSDSLLSLLRSDKSAQKRDIDVTFEAAIVSNAAEINSIGTQAATAAATARAGYVCLASELIFGAHVITPSSSDYTTEEDVNWSTTCRLPANCFIKIQSNIHLALALKLITTLGSTFAVRSGGHSPNPGFASVDKTGVLLDLSPLNQISLSSDKTTALVGTGARWIDVYTTLETEHLTVVGGRVSDVGVGGLILGGGMSHFSNFWGMPADNVKNFKVVLADSTIVNANAHTNADLFKALKGGGPNFGIVTEFELYTYPNYQVWYTFNVYSAADSAAVLTAASSVEAAMNNDKHAGFFLTSASGMFVAGFVYLGWQSTTPAAYSAFSSITPLAVAVPITNGTASSVSIAANAPGTAKRVCGTVAVNTNATLYEELVDAYNTVATSANVSSDYSIVFTFQPLGAASVAQSNVKGGNVMGVTPVSQAVLSLAVTWTADTEDATAKAQINSLISSLRSTASARGELLAFQFMNDAGYQQDPLKSYGTTNLATIQAVAKKYDPNAVFQTLQNSGFKLSKA